MSDVEVATALLELSIMPMRLFENLLVLVPLGFMVCGGVLALVIILTRGGRR